MADNTLPARSSTVKDMREESLNLPKQQALQLWRCSQQNSHCIAGMLMEFEVKVLHWDRVRVCKMIPTVDLV